MTLRGRPLSSKRTSDEHPFTEPVYKNCYRNQQKSEKFLTILKNKIYPFEIKRFKKSPDQGLFLKQAVLSVFVKDFRKQHIQPSRFGTQQNSQQNVAAFV